MGVPGVSLIGIAQDFSGCDRDQHTQRLAKKTQNGADDMVFRSPAETMREKWRTRDEPLSLLNNYIMTRRPSPFFLFGFASFSELVMHEHCRLELAAMSSIPGRLLGVSRVRAALVTHRMV
jgi:hypothetical protein